MILRALIAACVALAMLVGVQTWRLSNCLEKAKLLDTCEEVDRIERETRDADDSTLLEYLIGR